LFTLPPAASLPTITPSPLSWSLLGLLWTILLGPIEPALGHGARIDYTIQPQVNLVARYDSGEPMAAANVTIYSPANPAEPWQTLTTDAEGRVQFSPDASQAGEWAVKVRAAGHGSLMTFKIGDSAHSGEFASTQGETQPEAQLILASSASAPELSPMQRIVVAASVIWGFVGTGFYFMRKS